MSKKTLTRKEVLAMTGYSIATLYRRIKEGLWPESYNVGGRSVRFLASECEKIWTAFENNVPHDEIRELRKEMVQKRQKKFVALTNNF